MKPGHLPQPPRSVVADADGPAFRPLGLRSLGAGLLLSASSSSSSSSSASSSAAQRQQQQQQLAWGGQPDDYAQEGSPSRMRLHHPYGGSTYGDMMRSAASTPSLPGSFGSQGQLGGGGAGGLSRRFSQPVALSSSAGISGQGLQEPPQHGFKVYVMLPLDTVNSDGVFKFAAVPWFTQALQLLVASGAYGVALDVWWGAVEKEPRQYNWSGYKQVLEMLKQTGLKVQVVLSFHACGGNVGDTAQIPLPDWVLQCGGADPDLFFTDRPRNGGVGQRNREYVSIWADDAPGVLRGRSPLQCYEDFMVAFRDAFFQDLGQTIEEVVVGTGPCGELRLPSYVEANGWRFPGAGEFQCYDRRALASLAQAAKEAGHAEWGYAGPHDAGTYNSNPEQTGFFAAHNGSWDTPYGRFFLDWYSSCLLKHGERLLSVATSVFAPKLQLHPGAAAALAQQHNLQLATPPPSAPMSCRLSCQSSQMLDRILETAAYELTLGGSTQPHDMLRPASTRGSGPGSGPQSGTGLGSGPYSLSAAGLAVHRSSGSGSSPPGAGPQPNGSGPGGAGGNRGTLAQGMHSLSVGAHNQLAAAAAAAAVTAVAAATVLSIDVPARLGSVDPMDVEPSDMSTTSAFTDVLPLRGGGLMGLGAMPLAAAKFHFSSSTIMEDGDPQVARRGSGGGASSSVAAALALAGSTAPPSSSSSAPGGTAGSSAGASGPATLGGALGGSGAGSAGGHNSGSAARMDHICNSRSSLSMDFVGAGNGGGMPYLDVAALVADGDDLSEVGTSYTGGLEEAMCDDLFMPLGARGSALSDFGGHAPGAEDLQPPQQQRRRSAELSNSGGLGGGGGGAPPGSMAAASTATAAASAAAAAAMATAGATSNPGLPVSPALGRGGRGGPEPAAYTPPTLHQTTTSPGCLSLALKIAGIHWWYRSRSHAAELTAGYYNTDSHDGYAAIVNMCAKRRVNLVLTCVEMCNSQHPAAAHCGPEGLLRQLRTLAARAGVALSGENALPIFSGEGVDALALDRIVQNTRPLKGAPLAGESPLLAPHPGHQQHQYQRPLSQPQQYQVQLQRPLQQQQPNGGGGEAAGPLLGLGGSIGNNIVSLGVSRVSDSGGRHLQLPGTGLLYSYHYGGQPCSPAGPGGALFQHHQSAPPSSSHGWGAPASPAPPPLSSNGAAAQGPGPQGQAQGGAPAGEGDVAAELLPALRSFTFLRLAPELLLPHHQGTWMKFMSRIQHGGGGGAA